VKSKVLGKGSKDTLAAMGGGGSSGGAEESEADAELEAGGGGKLETDDTLKLLSLMPADEGGELAEEVMDDVLVTEETLDRGRLIDDMPPTTSPAPVTNENPRLWMVMVHDSPEGATPWISPPSST
jgi:hypothetical protein